jgi:hypothetical protein
MKVGIKKFSVDMDVKTSGIEFEVYENGPNGAHRGDCILTKTGLIWCEGRTRRANGKQVSWNDFIDWMNGRP